MKKEGAVVGLADGILYADDKAIYQAENLKVGLFKQWKELWLQELELFPV